MHYNSNLESYLVEHQTFVTRFSSLYTALDTIVKSGSDYADSQARLLSMTLSLSVEAFTDTLGQLKAVCGTNSLDDVSKLIRVSSSFHSLDSEIEDILGNEIFYSPSSSQRYLDYRGAIFVVASQLCDLAHEFSSNIQLAYTSEGSSKNQLQSLA